MLNRLEQLKNKLSSKKQDLKNFEIDPDDFETEFDDLLNESGPVRIAGLEFDQAYALKELDPTAYRCGLLDYIDSIDKSEVEEYKNLESEIEDLESEIEDLESEIEEI